MKLRKWALMFLLLLGGLLFTSPLAAYTLPDNYYVRYGDFLTWDLPLLEIIYPDEDFVIDTSPGLIKDDVVLYTFPEAARDNEDQLGLNADEAYKESQNNTGSFSFSQEPDPDPSFSFDNPDTWDTEISSLRTFLDGQDLVFFFNNNQSGNELRTISLFGWGQVTLEDAEGILDPLYFDFINPYSPKFANAGGELDPAVESYTSDGSKPVQPDVFMTTNNPDYLDDETFVLDDPTTWTFDDDDYYAFIPGEAWFNPLTGDLELFQVNNDYRRIKLNLGANDAAYAAFSPELNAIVNDPNSGYDIMRVDFRLAYLNNGYEQLLIRGVDVEDRYVIPEPTTLLLLGFGLIGFAGLSRRKFNK